MGKTYSDSPRRAREAGLQAASLASLARCKGRAARHGRASLVLALASLLVADARNLAAEVSTGGAPDRPARRPVVGRLHPPHNTNKGDTQ